MVKAMPPMWGSSPLTRGKPMKMTLLIQVGRLIPARAGKTREEDL